VCSGAPAADDDKLYVAVSDVRMTRKSVTANGATQMQRTLRPDKGGGMFALRLSSGEKIWYAPPAAVCAKRANCSPAQSGAVSLIPGTVFSGSLDGHLRAYSSEDGRVLWDYDTVRDFTTVNGVAAHGGSLDGPGPTIAGRIVYTNSGYGRFGGTAGNVLLAFSVDGK
jgi:polyvinyl alcohol dehydrogenase (cytochrome)